MQSPRPEFAPLPYEETVPSLLRVICSSLSIIYRGQFEARSDTEVALRLTRAAALLNEEKWARSPHRLNPHVLDGISTRHASRSSASGSTVVPRISRLCLEAVRLAQKPLPDAPDRSGSGIMVPSPFSILVEALTVPERPESAAYGFAIARAMLLARYDLRQKSDSAGTVGSSLSIANIRHDLESFRTYFKHRDNIHYAKENPARVFLAEFLALKGAFLLRFGTTGKTREVDAAAKKKVLSYLEDFPTQSRAEAKDAGFEFRLAPDFVDIPDTQELLNSLMGIPMPMSGFSTVFFGGLQRSHDNSVVVSISGPPGSGKTSVALSFAASLAPFATQCLYLTFEEDEETLKRRALSLTPTYLRRTTLKGANVDDWFRPIRLESPTIGGVERFTNEYLSVLRTELRKALDPRGDDTGSQPAIAPALLVVDSLTTLASNSDPAGLEQFYNLVLELKSLNCIVLLLSAEEVPRGSRLEYLVDTVIALVHDGIDRADVKPTRLLKLAKTRLQMSRPGAHVLHLSGDRGLRVSPQLPSQLDEHRTHRTLLPDSRLMLDAFRVDPLTKRMATPRDGADFLVKVYAGSRLLIHGHGSSSKASMALRTLMSPVVDATHLQRIEQPSYRSTRILAVSFLYPREYYDRVHKVLQRGFRSRNDALGESRLDVLALTPSFIRAEDFSGQVLHALEQGHLEGYPYTGVLLDGLHNVFLQFPALQDSHMVWPALYSLLSRYEVTVATTFTVFSTSFSSIFRNQLREDEEFILHGQLPFLHALVRGMDFMLRVERLDQASAKREFLVAAESALGQSSPTSNLVWDADRLNFPRRHATREPDFDLA